MAVTPRVSVVIPSGSPSRRRNLDALIQDFRDQSLAPLEIEVVRGVSPNGRARNQGAHQTSGEIIVFADDDIRLGHRDVVRTMVEHLQTDERLGLVGTAQQLPLDSSPFQIRCAEQLPRSQSQVVEELTDSDMVTTQCCAIRREVLFAVGGFHDRIPRGVDPELRRRLREHGFRVAVVPRSWHYHPMPHSLRGLVQLAWRDGRSSAEVQRRFPEIVIDNPEGHVADFEASVPRLQRILRRCGWLFRDLAGGRTWGAIYSIVYSLAYLVGALAGDPSGN